MKSSSWDNMGVMEAEANGARLTLQGTGVNNAVLGRPDASRVRKVRAAS